MDNILNNIFSTYDFFLFEVFAIPDAIRKEYLNKLLTRKGGSKQKNVRFLRHIYKVLEENKHHLWDEALICKELDISARMLDCYKSRILKSLREHYFDWENKLKDLKDGFSGDDIDMEMAIARKMFSIGMIKESKHAYLKAENEVKKLKNKDSVRYRILLSEIYEALCTYYYLQRDQRKFSRFLSLSEANLVKSQKLLKEKDLALVKVRALKSRYWKAIFRSISSKSVKESVSILREMLRLSKELKSVELLFFVYQNLGIMEGKAGNHKTELNYFREGFKLAEKKGFSEYAMVFDMGISFNEFKRDNKKAKSFYKKAEKYYNQIKNNYTYYNNLLDLQAFYVRMLIYFNKPGSDDLAEEYIKSFILFSHKMDAVSKWYLELSDRLSSGIYQWVALQKGPGEFELDVTVDKNLHSYFEEMNYNTLIHFNGLYSPETLAVLYLNQIDLEFWKGKECNYENAMYFINKLSRLIKTRHIGTNKSWLVSAKIGVSILEEMKLKSKKEVFDKYFPDIKSFIDSIKDERQIFNIVDDFAKLIFVAKLLGSSRMKTEIKNLHSWIKKNQPEILSAIIEVAEMKNREFRVA